MCLLTRVLLHAAWVSAAAISPPTKVRRDSTDLIDTIVAFLAASYASSLPNVTENGNRMLGELLEVLPDGLYSIPMKSNDSSARAEDLETVREYFLYETPSTGGPYWPAGELGLAKDALDEGYIQAEMTPQLAYVTVDGKKALTDVANYGNLETLDDYVSLYDGEWLNSLPNGPDLGVLTNYTQDLYFSMQRLTSSPFAVRRLKPSSDKLPFTLGNGTAESITGTSLKNLLKKGRLFYADHRSQASMERTTRYAAACDAYFYIDATSGDFLPLAIRTNVDADLIYTPLDSEGDWLLAKMMYNANDFWFAQWNHLAGTHYVIQVVWMAAIRSLSYKHPIYAILNRITYENFAIRVLAETVLFTTGGAVDLILGYTGDAANTYTNALYNNGSGSFKANYFKTDLKTRGLINSPVGPALKHFPYYEDAGVIFTALHTFFDTFVRSYYPSDRAVAADTEIQNWVAECNGDAEVMDFPREIKTIDTLVDVLTHMGHLVTSVHHAVNTNELLQVSATLPFNPTAFKVSLPTKKSNSTDPVDYLPAMEQVVEQLVVSSLFARPLLVDSNRTLIHMFDNQTMLDRLNKKTQTANAAFMEAMQAQSAAIQARTFDNDGLCNGVPFIWTGLDPSIAPYSLTV